MTDTERLEWMIEHEAFCVNASGDGYYVGGLSDYIQPGMYKTPREAIDAAMQQEREREREQ